uniref:CCHC-type domain-containing protein n=1 Tax=Tanacetum cinerariifolium TaxID=118510 RepID=A0A699HRK6_TANCI|nr:hypothetical protein [Tanacetum cinerariifolium]
MDQDAAHMVAASKVIENGNSLPKTQIVEGVETVMSITSVEDKAQRRLEVKAKSTLMMGIPNEHQLKINFIKDAKSLLEAIEKRIQKLVSQLELLKEIISQEDVNQKFLRSLPSEWNMHVVVWRNKPDLDSMSMDDLYNKLKMAVLTIRARRFLKNTGRKLNLNGNETVAFNKTKVECYNCHKRGHFKRECRASKAQDNRNKESIKRNVPIKTTNSLALVSCDGLGGYDWSDQAKEGPNYELMAYSNSSFDSESLNKLIDSQIVDNCKKGLGYNAVPPPHTGLFMPLKPDLSYIGLEEFTSEPAVKTLNAKTSKDVPMLVKRDNGAPIIKD